MTCLLEPLALITFVILQVAKNETATECHADEDCEDSCSDDLVYTMVHFFYFLLGIGNSLSVASDLFSKL